MVTIREVLERVYDTLGEIPDTATKVKEYIETQLDMLRVMGDMVTEIPNPLTGETYKDPVTAMTELMKTFKNLMKDLSKVK